MVVARSLALPSQRRFRCSTLSLQTPTSVLLRFYAREEEWSEFWAKVEPDEVPDSPPPSCPTPPAGLTLEEYGRWLASRDPEAYRDPRRVPTTPCNGEPGSPAKVEELARRLAAGVPLWNPHDLDTAPRLLGHGRNGSVFRGDYVAEGGAA